MHIQNQKRWLYLTLQLLLLFPFPLFEVNKHLGVERSLTRGRPQGPGLQTCWYVMRQAQRVVVQSLDVNCQPRAWSPPSVAALIHLELWTEGHMHCLAAVS